MRKSDKWIDKKHETKSKKRKRRNKEIKKRNRRNIPEKVEKRSFKPRE